MFTSPTCLITGRICSLPKHLFHVARQVSEMEARKWTEAVSIRTGWPYFSTKYSCVYPRRQQVGGSLIVKTRFPPACTAEPDPGWPRECVWRQLRQLPPVLKCWTKVGLPPGPAPSTPTPPQGLISLSCPGGQRRLLTAGVFWYLQSFFFSFISDPTPPSPPPPIYNVSQKLYFLNVSTVVPRISSSLLWGV